MLLIQYKWHYLGLLWEFSLEDRHQQFEEADLSMFSDLLPAHAIVLHSFWCPHFLAWNDTLITNLTVYKLCEFFPGNYCTKFSVIYTNYGVTPINPKTNYGATPINPKTNSSKRWRTLQCNKTIKKNWVFIRDKLYVRLPLWTCPKVFQHIITLALKYLVKYFQVWFTERGKLYVLVGGSRIVCHQYRQVICNS